jgi:hypothetical protein
MNKDSLSKTGDIKLGLLRPQCPLILYFATCISCVLRLMQFIGLRYITLF